MDTTGFRCSAANAWLYILGVTTASVVTTMPSECAVLVARLWKQRRPMDVAAPPLFYFDGKIQ
jgi:hypothetical protein